MRRRSEDDYYEDAHDERVEPNADLDETHGGMPSPDWARTLVHTGGKTQPVGDPTVWGGSITTQIDSDPVLGNTPRVIGGGQVILAQAKDRYARSWSLTGVLWVNSTILGTASPDTAPPSYVETFPVTPTTPTLTVWLSVLMGVERMQQEHQILLMAGDQAQNFGLCWNQNSGNGGPYGAQIPDPINSAMRGLPFACIGALIGNTLAIQGIYVRGPTLGAEVCPEVRLTCMVTPYAPGQGI
jgi:hypothetical protein